MASLTISQLDDVTLRATQYRGSMEANFMRQLVS